MNPESKILLDIHKEEFENYKKYIDSNNWFDDVFFNTKKGKLESSKLNTEVSIIETIIKSTNKFKEDVGEDIDKKPIQSFIKFTADIINRHIERIAKYKRMYPLGNVELDQDDEESEISVESEVEFHSDLFALITKTKVALSKLKIDENEMSKKSLDLFFGNQKAPLLMRDSLCRLFPIIKDKTDNLDIDFKSSIINPATSNEMFINMKSRDIPDWDPNKHFFEQDKSTIQFWEEERRKIMHGINIYGFYISPWLYWHLNHFKLSFGAGLDKKTIQPDFRDNEYFFDQMHDKAEKNGQVGLLMYGSRRWSKTVNLSSRVVHKILSMNKANGTIQGYSEKPDLEAIVNYISDAFENIHPALKIPANSMDLKEGVILGVKGKKAQDRIDHSKLSVINLEGGNTKKGGQKTAGSTPDIFVFDEIAKSNCITPWMAAIPSFAGGRNGKWRLTPLLAATAGDAELSKDAERMLKDPNAYNIMPMDWDLLEDFIDPDQITWKRNTFGMFLPAQMSLEAPDKILKPFGDYLKESGRYKKIDFEGLNNLKIKVTDWENARLKFENNRDNKKSDLYALATYTNSFPLDPEDCYITTEKNIFPGLECKNRKSFIETKGLQGEKYRLYRDQYGEFHAEMVPNDVIITDYPFKGGNFDAPVVMLENPLLQDSKPPLGLYTIGFDDVKQETSSGDSVISATVFKRGFEGGEWADRFVAWFDSRPDRKQDYYKTLYILIKIFNARVLMENEDNGFLEWMEANHMDDVHIHLSTGVGLASEENLTRNSNRRFGWSPTPINIYRLNQKMVMYTKADGITINGVDGLSGVDRINHPMLLEEMYKFKKDNNTDRIRSGGLALTLAQYYDKTYQYMKNRKKEIKEDNKPKKSSFSTVNGFSHTNKLTKW